MVFPKMILPKPPMRIRKEMTLKNKISKTIFTLAIMCCVASGSYGQYLQIPYFCGFEDTVENANWVFNDVSGSLNKWKIGTAEKNIGDYGLYVSFDDGVTAGNNNTKNYVTVSREFTLQPGIPYDISFDWKNPGYGYGKLYICWIPASYTIPSTAALTDALPTWLKTWGVFDGDTLLSGASVWQNKTFNVTGTGQVYKLLFFWVNTASSTHPSGKIFPAACIDNVQISKKNGCPRPANFRYTHIDASRGRFDWNSGAEKHEVMYKSANDTAFTTVTVYNYDETLSVRALKKGAYIAYIRSICDGDTSIWSVYPNILVHYSDNSCIDFLNLYDRSVVDTWSGTFDTPYMNQGLVRDYGYASAASRHTIHYVADEYDARTNFRLRTTPPDGMPAIRIGTWDTPPDFSGGSGFADVIEYKYTVTADAPLLLMKYAIVLEDGSDLHPDPKDQPRFTLTILDENNQSVAEFICGEADFAADRNAEGWQLGMGNAVWKDWTSLGLNLQSFVGQQPLSISLKATGCKGTMHYGYAYFSMDCMGAKISGIGCGDNMFGKIEAPEGFRYKWYPQGNEGVMDLPNYADTLQTFSPPGGASDIGVYICRVISTEDPDCWFELEARLDPRDVFNEFDYQLNITDCKAEVAFENKSYTLTRNGQERGECEEFYWDFGNGYYSYEENPVVNFAPGTYNVRFVSSISEGLCSEIDSVTITIPQYGNSIDTVYAYTCTNNPDYLFEGVTYSTTGIRTVPLTSVFGCDSIRVLNLTVSSEYRETRRDTITSDVEYDFYGRQLTESGFYSHAISGQNGNCDSIIELYLVVYPALHVDFNESYLPDICEGDPDFSFSYGVENGTVFNYSILFFQKALDTGFTNQIMQPHTDGVVTINLDANILPGDYEAQLIFYGDTCGNDTFNVVFPVYYPSRILEQKWNDVIAVLNKNYNGGYVFTDFSWYVNGVQIPNQTGSYIYLPPALEFGAEYRARLTRQDDGIAAFTCPIIPVPKVDIHVSPTLVSGGNPVMITSAKKGKAKMYDVMGNSIKFMDLEGNNIQNQIITPVRKGVYLLMVEVEGDGIKSFRIMVE